MNRILFNVINIEPLDKYLTSQLAAVSTFEPSMSVPVHTCLCAKTSDGTSGTKATIQGWECGGSTMDSSTKKITVLGVRNIIYLQNWIWLMKRHRVIKTKFYPHYMFYPHYTIKSELCLRQCFCNRCILYQSQAVLKDKVTTSTLRPIHPSECESIKFKEQKRKITE